MLIQDPLAEGVDLTLKDDLVPGPLEAKVEATDPGKE